MGTEEVLVLSIVQIVIAAVLLIPAYLAIKILIRALVEQARNEQIIQQRLDTYCKSNHRRST